MAGDTADRIGLWALTGCSGLMIFMLVLPWYRANFGGLSVNASGFSAARLLAIFVMLARCPYEERALCARAALPAAVAPATALDCSP